MLNIKKYIVCIITGLIFTLPNISAKATDEDSFQKIRAGTFVKVMVMEEFSTLTADIEDELKFINTSDMYVYETNAIPKDTIFYGEAEDVLEPVEGKDGAIKILINKMVTPDKKVYKIKGHIYSDNDNYIGGKQTEPIYYRKVPQYNKGLRPFLQVAPLNVFEMGKHTVILPGAELFLIIEEDIKLK